jgi:hypothetical protein
MGLRPTDRNEEALFVGRAPSLRPTPTSARPRIPETVQPTASSTECSQLEPHDIAKCSFDTPEL